MKYSLKMIDNLNDNSDGKINIRKRIQNNEKQ